MADSSKTIFLVIHGHFYQPPRENPWSQTIPAQASASPYHDWNERITAECYAPNTRSRVLDEHGNIVQILNNFAYINFNIGPTLFSWLATHHPDTYRRILEADVLSRARNQGHGNAIAQVYNHVILPLAHERDLRTQIVWGEREFQHRFGREPEAIWLAETAINQRTINELIAQGLKYVILSPTQARRVRPLGESTWIDVSGNTIDTTQPYRLFYKDPLIQSDSETQKASAEIPPGLPSEDLPEETTTQVIISETDESLDSHEEMEELPSFDYEQSGQYIDAFFYDGELSTDISFRHLLRDANVFAGKIAALANTSAAPQVLIHVATDGEVYGHHEQFGDMCLAAALTSHFPALHIKPTNYGWYLAQFPPTQEVELKSGGANEWAIGDEGTAWSCAHGVGRWYRDCGCSISQPPGWNQQWRTPLRRGFDLLRDALATVFEQSGGELFHDPWEARNAYIECLLNPSQETLTLFFHTHATHALTDDEQVLALRLLEAQRYSLYAYTSCAWFFDDISGIEVQQNMRYAARAIQLMEGLIPQDLEELILAEWAQARSNLPEMGTGQEVYLRFVKPDVYTPERAANQFLLSELIAHHFMTDQETINRNQRETRLWTSPQQITLYHIECPEYTVDRTRSEDPGVPCYYGVLRVLDVTTRQPWMILFVAMMEQATQPVTYLKRVETPVQMSSFAEALSTIFGLAGAGFSPLMTQEGFRKYDLADVYAEDRERLFCHMMQRHLDRAEEHLQTIYHDSLDVLEALSKMHVQVPSQLKASVEFSLSHQLLRELERLPELGAFAQLPAALSAELEKILTLSRHHQLHLDTTLLQERFSQALKLYVDALSRQVGAAQSSSADGLKLLQEILALLEKAEMWGVTLDKTPVQNLVYDVLEAEVPRYLALLNTALEQVRHAEQTPPAEHDVYYRFFQEYARIQAYLQLAQRLNFNIERYHTSITEAISMNTILH